MDTLQEKKPTLLLVDDEENILRSLKRNFFGKGYDILLANSGANALALLAEHSIDVVISDMRMPEMTGAQFLKAVAAQWPDTKRILLTGYTDMDSAIAAINEGQIDFYFTKPWDEKLDLGIKHVLENKRIKDHNKLLQQKLSQQNEDLIKLNAELDLRVQQRTKALEEALDKLKKNHASAIQVLSSIVEIHEGERWKGHCRRIAECAKMMAKVLFLPDDQVEDIYLASLLHNIGKIGLPVDIINKPYQTLKISERIIVEKYPTMGALILLGFEPFSEAAKIIASHRERNDGSGYPHRLKANDIPIAAQIVGAAVEYNELQQGFLVPDHMIASQAFQYMHGHGEKHFSRGVLNALRETVRGLPSERERSLERIYSIQTLKPDMVLSRDLLTPQGVLLLRKGHRLTVQQIERLGVAENLTVYIHAAPI